MTYLLSDLEIDRWHSQAKLDGSISKTLRQLARERGFVSAHELSSAAGEIFEERIAVEDRQVLWKWNLDGSAVGFDDQEVDALLSHLLA